MITEYLNAEFDEMTTDVGQELKDTARRIYVRSLQIFLALAALEIICVVAIGSSADDTDVTPFGWFVAAAVAVLVEFFVLQGVRHIVALKLYAKGEMVHLLKNNGVEDKKDSAYFRAHDVQTEAEVNEVPVADAWECAFCGSKNADNFCARCGKSKEESQEASESWVCGKCNTLNSLKYSQCKNCAALRNGTDAALWENVTRTSIADTWKCDNCGARNSNNYGQCKKCGTYRA